MATDQSFQDLGLDDGTTNKKQKESDTRNVESYF